MAFAGVHVLVRFLFLNLHICVHFSVFAEFTLLPFDVQMCGNDFLIMVILL